MFSALPVVLVWKQIVDGHEIGNVETRTKLLLSIAKKYEYFLLSHSSRIMQLRDQITFGSS